MLPAVKATVVDEIHCRQGHRAGWINGRPGGLPVVLPALPNLIHLYFFKWGKIVMNQWLAEETSPCPCKGMAASSRLRSPVLLPAPRPSLPELS